jgi:hypothetical protein
MRFVLSSGSQTIVDVTIPGGAFDPTAPPEARRGWVQRGVSFDYGDHAAAIAGIQRISARPSSGRLRVTVFGRGGNYPLPQGPEVTMTFIANPESPERQCADVVFTDGRCRFRNQGGKLVCH